MSEVHPIEAPIVSIVDTIKTLRAGLVGGLRCSVKVKGEQSARVLSIQRFSEVNDRWFIDCWCHKAAELLRLPIALILKNRLEKDEARLLPAEILADKWTEDEERSVCHQYRENLGELDKWLDAQKKKCAALASEQKSSSDGSGRKGRYVQPIGKVPRAPRPSAHGKGRKNFGFKVDPKAGFPQRMTDALGALIKEIKETGSSLRTIRLSGGKPHVLQGHGECVRFVLESDLPIFDGLKVFARVENRRVQGKIISAASNHLLVAFEARGRSAITECVIEMDDTSLLERLKAQIAQVSQKGQEGFNEAIARTAITSESVKKVERKKPPAFDKNLNTSQQRAIKNALGKTVSYIWGPPGTGKTFALGELTRILYDQGEKVLVCSNTNLAVDQLLLKLCNSFGKSHEAIKKGHVIRIGEIGHQELSGNWGDLINVDHIADRKGKVLIEKKAKLEAKLLPLQEQLAVNKKFLLHFGHLKKLNIDLEKVSGELAEAKSGKSSIDGKLRKLPSKTDKEIANLEEKIRNHTRQQRRLIQEAGKRERAVLKIAHRSEALIKIDRERVKEILEKSNALLKKIPLKTKKDKLSLEKQQQKAKNQLLKLTEHKREIDKELKVSQKEVAGAGEKTAKDSVEKLKKKIGPLEKALSEVVKELAALRAAVVKEAKVVGSTVTKTHLEPTTFKDSDVVIIDEASMILLPAVYFAAGLAKKSVVVSGDFQQLQAIVNTNQQALKNEIGVSVFEASGVQKKCQDGVDFPHVTMLDTQYRMPEPICNLIAGPFYNGQLKTQRSDTTESNWEVEGSKSPITIVDTSSLNSLEQFSQGRSRYNLLHAEVVRSIVRRIQRDGQIKGRSSLGVCSPYAAQADLLNALIEDEGLGDLVRVRTVHKWQGDEVNTLILDIPTGVTRSGIGRYLDREQVSDDEAKVLNVAFSRAKERLIIIANLKELNKKLPNYAVLRDLLSRAEETGDVIAGKKLLEGVPNKSIFTSLARLESRPQRQSPTQPNQQPPAQAKPQSKSQEKTEVEPTTRQPKTKTKTAGEKTPIRMTDAKQFAEDVQNDIKTAKETIAIYSGFITDRRVSRYDKNFEDRINNGVTIRCVTKPPGKNTSNAYMHESAKRALKRLKQLGCLLDLRDEIHQKIVIIDEKIVWFGSCNPLSHRDDGTDETMQRTEGVQYARQIASFVSLNTPRGKLSKRGVSVMKENPGCPKCRSLWTVLVKRRSNDRERGNPWRCADKKCLHHWRA